MNEIIGLLMCDETLIFTENNVRVIKEFKFNKHQLTLDHEITWKTDFELLIKEMLKIIRNDMEIYKNKLKKGLIK